jgi:two-component system, cell cycle sensor histidine kinase and response regulator CckA
MTSLATVLVVDDERDLRRIARRTLELDQLTVLEAEDGEAALILIERGEPLDLVVTDLVMPRLGGMELVETLRQFRPELPLVVISGWSQSPATRSLLEEYRIPVLAKPFTPTQLTSLVRQALEETRQAPVLLRSRAQEVRAASEDVRRKAGHLVAAAYRLKARLGAARP